MVQQSRDAERRRWPCVNMAAEVTYCVVEPQMEPQNFRTDTTLNVSAGGVCFSSHEAMRPGSVVAGEVSLADLRAPVAYLGRVARAGRSLAGVQFWRLSWAEGSIQGEIARYVNSERNAAEAGAGA